MIKFIMILVGLLILGIFGIDQFYPKVLNTFIIRYKPFITCLSIISALGIIASFYITFYQQQQAKEARLSNLSSEILVNLNICQKELKPHFEKYKILQAIPVPESRFHTNIIESALSSGDITQKEINMVLWNSFRQMNLINSLLNQALLIRHSEHIADPKDKMLIEGRRSKVNSLVTDSIGKVDKVISLLNEAKIKFKI